MKKVCCILILAVCLVAGCGTAPAERIAAYERAIDKAQGVSDSIDAQAGELLGVKAMAQALLADPAVTDSQRAEAMELIADVEKKLAEAVPYKQEAAAKIAKLKAAVEKAKSGGDFADELAFYGEVVGESAPYLGKYGLYALIVKGLLLAAAAIFAKKKAADAKAAQEAATVATAKYQAHKVGVESTLKEMAAAGTASPAQVASTLYNNIGKARAAAGIA